jgi:hypothetical protein
MRATHQPYIASVQTGIGYTDVPLQPGELIFGRHEFAKILRRPPGSLPKRIQKLILLENIRVKSNNHFSIITIVNWDVYAKEMDKKKQARKQRGNSEETHTIIKNTDTQDQELIVPRTKTVRFTPPTLDEVSEYCKSRNNTVDPIKFHSHYTANGWRVGKNPMKNWKAAIVTWERNNQ